MIRHRSCLASTTNGREAAASTQPAVCIFHAKIACALKVLQLQIRRQCCWKACGDHQGATSDLKPNCCQPVQSPMSMVRCKHNSEVRANTSWCSSCMPSKATFPGPCCALITASRPGCNGKGCRMDLRPDCRPHHHKDVHGVMCVSGILVPRMGSLEAQSDLGYKVGARVRWSTAAAALRHKSWQSGTLS